jgi:hypothetical protein
LSNTAFILKVPTLISYPGLGKYWVILGEVVLYVLFRTQSRNFMDKGWVKILVLKQAILAEGIPVPPQILQASSKSTL